MGLLQYFYIHIDWSRTCCKTIAMFVWYRLFGAPGGPGSQFSRGDPNSGRYDHNSGESFGPSPQQYKSAKFPRPPQHYRVREDNSAELSARFDDDGSSTFDGPVDYSSHSPYRAPPSTAFSGRTAGDSQKDDINSEERQPHSFGSGYAFEFAGTDNGGETGVSAEFWWIIL